MKNRSVKPAPGNARTAVDAYRQHAAQEWSSGRGSQRTDKVARIEAPPQDDLQPEQARRWYAGNGFAANIIDAYATHSVREWFKVKVVSEGHNEIPDMIQARFKSLHLQKQLTSLVRYENMYKEGGLLYYGLCDREENDLKANPMSRAPKQIRKISHFTVFEPDDFKVQIFRFDPFDPRYNRPWRIWVRGRSVHPSRCSWLVHSLIPRWGHGVSMITKGLDALKAQDTALWSLNNVLFELVIKVLKSPAFGNAKKKDIKQDLDAALGVLSSLSALGLGPEETLERMVTQIPPLGDALNFIMENMAGMWGAPKSVIAGNATGIISAGMTDQIAWFNKIATGQKTNLQEVVQKCCGFVVAEQEGEIYQAFGALPDLRLEIEWNEIFKLDASSNADVNLKRAQKYQIDQTIGLVHADELRPKEYPELAMVAETSPEDAPLPDEAEPSQLTPDYYSQLLADQAAKGTMSGDKMPVSITGG